MTYFSPHSFLVTISYLLLSLALLPVINAQCSTPTGYQLSQTALDNKYRIFWTINATDATIDIALAVQTSGWLGFGISASTPASMVDAEAVIASFDVSPSIGSFLLAGRDSNMFAPIDFLVPLQNAITCEYTESGSTWTLATFRRSCASGKNPIRLNGPTPVIFAIGDSDTLAQHSSGNRLAANLDFATGELTVDGSSIKASRWQQAHGSLMFVGFGAALTIGMIVARYGKSALGENWIIVHLGLQSLGYFAAFAGFVIALYMVSGAHFKTKAHSQLGIAVIIAALVQLAIGFFRPHAALDGQKKSKIRLFWEQIHAWFGRLVLVVGIVTLFFGLYQYRAHYGWYIGLGVWVGLLAILMVVLEVLSRKNKYKPGRLTENHQEDL